ncbi:MAG: threonine--tRNA ligase [Bdellovibrionales bacterium]|nr:threonine--tRNA ligase [Bdellovibrionales bacterium]
MPDMISLSLPDGSIQKHPKGITPLEFASSIGAGLAKASYAALVNGKLTDLRAPILEDAQIEIVTQKHDLAGEVVRHSAEHIMADAVSRLWPKVQIDVGRTDHSEKFQYDFKMERNFTPEDLEKIQETMDQILASKVPFEREVVSREKAIELFSSMGQELKVSRIKDIPEDQDITLYRHGDFVDLCRGPHVQHAGQIGALMLLDSSSSYWRGDESNIALQRIYGTAFLSKKDLKEYVQHLEETKKRDHRRLGKQLDLFSISEDVGPGLVLWHPKGALVRHLIEDFWKKKHLQAGYEFVNSPHVARRHLWDTSGHTGFYDENMFRPMEVEDQAYQLKPMNCPFHIQIYKSKLRSYRDFPLRYAELGTVYRYERSGVLHGLMRVRGFTQDDAHLFVAPQQLREEIEKVLEFVLSIFKAFAFEEFEFYLSTRPEKSVGSDENWDIATKALKGALEAKNLKYIEDPGEGVFYGPKIDIKIQDSIGRKWQCSTIQADFSLPERFELDYVSSDGSRQTPIMLHRALLGSIERFFGILVEHYEGAFPLWLSPVQMKVLPITDAQLDYAKEVQGQLIEQGFRVELDDRSEKLGYKVREAQLEKIPYVLVIGAQEQEAQELAIRKRGGEKLPNMKLGAFIEQALSEVKLHS